MCTRCAQFAVWAPEPVSVVVDTTFELPRVSRNAEVGTPVVLAVDSAIVNNVAIVTIGHGEVSDTPCVSVCCR